MKKLFIVAGLAGTIGTAHADEASDAFARGKAALKAKRIHEACEAFAASEQAKPAIETELALASCLEQDGKLVASANMYRTAADKDTDAKRKKASMDKVAKLSARSPKLRFAINPKPDDILIKVDGVDVPTVGDVMVDLGPHEVTATAKGFEGHASAAVDREGQVLDVILRMEAIEPPPAPAPVETAPPAKPAPAEPAVAPESSGETEMSTEMPMAEEHSTSHRRRNGIIVGSVGLATLIGGAILFKVGSDKLDDQSDLCPNKLCANNADAERANDLRDDGRRYRGIGIGMGIGGAVLVAAGVVLFATAPSDSAAPVALNLENGGGTLTYSFGF